VKKYWKVLDFGFFVGDVISGIDFRPFQLRLLGPGHQPLEEIFDTSFYWKVGYNLSLWSLWLAF